MTGNAKQLVSEARKPGVLDHVPDPQVVRERLSETVREARLLRQLLKLSERVAKERPPQGVTAHA